MAQWVYVENNEIQGQYDLLPARWRNISGLNLSANDLPFLKSLGWYPVTKQATEHDSDHHVTGFDYVLRDNDVLEIELVERRTQPFNPTPQNNQRENFLRDLRQHRNCRLAESDWTQLPDVLAIHDHETQQVWQEYRQQLRDITDQYKHSDKIDSINNINWPRPCY
jgi:hypothetical protein